MAVQTTACARSYRQINAVHRGKGVNGNTSAEGKTAVVAARAKCGRNVLRAVIDRVRIRGAGQWRWRCVWAATHCLVVHTRGLSGALGRKPGFSIVVGE